MQDTTAKKHKGHFGMCPVMAVIILVTFFQLYRLHQLKNLLKEQEEVMTPVVTYVQSP
jgi:hypothetical protein